MVRGVPLFLRTSFMAADCEIAATYSSKDFRIPSGAASRSLVGVLRGRAQEAGVKVITGLKASEITEDSVRAVGDDGAEVTLGCDSVVLSMGVVPRSGTVRELEGCCDEVYVIGDCKNRAGNITSAVREGFYAAMNL